LYLTFVAYSLTKNVNMRKMLAVAFAVLVGNALFAQNRWAEKSESAIGRNLFVNRYQPQAYKIFQLNESAIRTDLEAAPSERRTSAAQSSFIISLPNSEGQMEQFSVVEAPVMDPALAARYPGIRSFAGKGIDEPGSTVRFDISPWEFHAMILSANRKTIYIDPVDEAGSYYVVFSRKDAIDYQRTFNCMTPVEVNPVSGSGSGVQTERGADDGRLRTYRLAMAATGEYSSHFLDGTETTDAQRKAKVLAAMNTAMVRTNGIYERDFGIRMNLVANNDLIIYLNAATDPWGSELNTTTQTTIDNVIGNANYDIGHLVHKAANNGNAGCIGCVCRTGQKGSAFTSHTSPTGDPFVVDYLTHEMGHQFGGNHTFSFNTEGTGANMEPGSGSTIMGYAGITGATTDVQPHSDDYFHAKSVEQITDYIKLGTGGGACAAVTITGNATPTINAGLDYVIPRSTPFALTASGTDADAGDVLTYTWEQYDNFATGSATVPSATSTSGPQFRSVTYSTNPTRTFPNLVSILGGTNTNKWEVLPSVARTLNFRATVRDNRSGGGQTRDDNMIVTVNGTAGPFAVTAPNTAITWGVGTTVAVTWSVNSTNVAPVNCTNVKISLSTDGGNTFPIVLLASTPNDGTENIVVPNNSSANCRVKIEAVGNIFFDISNVNFSISGTPPVCGDPTGLTSSSVTTSSATVSWAAVSGANNYLVEYKANSSATWLTVATTNGTTVNIAGLTANTLYDWRVRANCTAGSGNFVSTQFTTQPIAAGCVTAFEPNETQATAAAITAGSE
jgi:Metallo-peptidase family M12B Reprolysin-like/Fibronectin type III domain